MRAVRAALYHRVSTLDQHAELARAELRGRARALKARVMLDVEEKGSGAQNDRPGLQRVLEAARAGKVDVVICWKLDRWGRSALDVLANIRELESAGVRFVCTSQNLDVRPGGDAMSRLLLQVLAAVAEFERDLISDRTRLGLARAAARGAKIGRPMVPRPDVEAVRQALLQQPRASREMLAERLRCSVHAVRAVLPLVVCKCGKAGTSSCECGRPLCGAWWCSDDHKRTCRRRRKRGSRSRAATSTRARSPRGRVKNHRFPPASPAAGGAA